MKRFARLLRSIADRIDRAGAPKFTGWSFTFERGLGLAWHNDNRGCPVAFLGDDDYERAFHPEIRTGGSA